METANKIYSNDSVDCASCGVSWAAIFAGAAAAAALSLILLVLGVGLGFSTISPWPGMGISAATLGVSTIVWLIVTQLVASGMGGYLAGRLRIRWVTMHTDEVYFRDTAHGLLAWAVASLVVIALVGTMTGKAISGVASTGAIAATAALDVAGATAGSASADAMGKGAANNPQSMTNYMVDSLFRSIQTADSPSTSDMAIHIEAGRIITNSIRSPALPPQDAQYLAQIIAKRTGLSLADAEKRVNETFTQLQTAITTLEQKAREAADTARKATAYSALWMFVALLSGAFIASFSATLGGRHRDHVAHVKRTS